LYSITSSKVWVVPVPAEDVAVTKF
jgi:hypothetical protein